MTDNEARAVLNQLAPMLWSPEGDCANCGRPVTEWADRLIHVGPDGYKSSVGCRAASFDWREVREDGERNPWDDSLKRSLKARLSRG